MKQVKDEDAEAKRSRGMLKITLELETRDKQQKVVEEQMKAAQAPTQKERALEEQGTEMEQQKYIQLMSQTDLERACKTLEDPRAQAKSAGGTA